MSTRELRAKTSKSKRPTCRVIGILDTFCESALRSSTTLLNADRQAPSGLTLDATTVSNRKTHVRGNGCHCRVFRKQLSNSPSPCSTPLGQTMPQQEALPGWLSQYERSIIAMISRLPSFGRWSGSCLGPLARRGASQRTIDAWRSCL